MDQAALTITTERVGDAHRATVAGEVDFMTAAELDERLSVVIRAARAQDVEVDLSQLWFIDSTGLAALTHLHFLAEEVGSRLVLVNPSTHVLRVIQLLKLDDALDIRMTGRPT